MNASGEGSSSMFSSSCCTYQVLSLGAILEAEARYPGMFLLSGDGLFGMDFNIRDGDSHSDGRSYNCYQEGDGGKLLAIHHRGRRTEIAVLHDAHADKRRIILC